MPSMIKPKMRITGVDENNYLTDIELIDSLVNANNLPTYEGKTHIRICKRYVNKNSNSESVILELDPFTAHLLNGSGKIFLGNQRVQIEEYINVRKCGRCLRYPHSTSECDKKGKLCINCGSDQHLRAECQNKPCCANCVERNENLKLNLNVEHNVLDKNCPTLLDIIKSIKRRTIRIDDEEWQNTN